MTPATGRSAAPAEPGSVPVSAELAALARAHNVDTGYDAWDGTRVTVSARSLVAVLGALGVDARTPRSVAAELRRVRRRRASRLVPHCLVSYGSAPAAVRLPPDASVRVGLESGGTRSVPAPDDATDTWRLPADLPLGYHTLHARHAGRDATAHLIVAPERISTPRDRGWGFTVQLHSCLSGGSWGMGDLDDLTRLATWSAADLAADFLLVNPLHAKLPAAYSDHSPYWPSSRRFADPVHVRVAAVPEYSLLSGAARERADQLAAEGGALRSAVLGRDALIDRDAVWALKREALALVHRVPRSPGRQAEYAAFTAREGERLRQFATWCALADVHGPNWREWPQELRDPTHPAVARARRELAGAVEFHQWLAWVTDEQLAAAQDAATSSGMAVGIIHDLAVGVHPDGEEAWALQHITAEGVDVGAPPDAFTAQGQNWHLPPWRPDRLAEAGYAPYAELLRSVMRHAGAVRIDHVLGLFRLWWVPRGTPLSEGAYVRYDHTAMLAVLALEAHRAGVLVIGEDLGTVGTGAREQLAGRGLLGTSVLWFEQRGPAEGGTGGAGPLPAADWRAQCLATLTTHDLPSTASRISGDHVDLRHRHGMLSRPLAEEQDLARGEVDRWLGELQREGLLTDAAGRPAAPDTALPPVTVALHRFLAHTPARLVGVWLPDTVGDLRAQNLPGTVEAHPNWQLAIADATGRPVALEELAASPGALELASVFGGFGRSPARTVRADPAPDGARCAAAHRAPSGSGVE